MPKLDGGDGSRVSATITIKVWSDGALSVEGPVEDPTWCMAALDNAKDAIRNQAKRKSNVIVPSYDVAIPALKVG